MSTDAELDAARKLAMEQLTDEERAAMADDLSDDEKAALKAIAGDDDDDKSDDGDDGGDDDGDDVAAAGSGEPGGVPGAVPAPLANKTDPAPHASDATTEDEIAPLPFKPQFKLDLPPDLDDQITALSAKESELAKQMKDGEIDVAEFLAQQNTVARERAALEAKRDQAATFEEMNRQTAEQEWHWTVAQFKARVKRAEGIDYAGNAEQDADLDTFVKAIASKPENADKDFSFFLTEAHKRVKALHGIGAAPAAKEDPPPKPRKAANAAAVPVTLASVPGGDGPGDVGNDEFAALDKLDGLEYETALARMTKEQRDRYLQSA